jgi:hypothetical protein
MDRYISPFVFEADLVTGDERTKATFELTTAREMNFKEDWLQRAIAANPELVIAACREAGLTDETWAFWAREFTVEPAGNIDILLVSESGRVAIVEAKLSYNPEGRRSVIAQTLEYAIHFPAIDESSLPPIPEVNGRPIAEKETVQSRIKEGDYLLIVTGDRLDSRAVKLGKSLLGRHLVNTWDLALVEIAVFRRRSEARSHPCLLVPHLRGAIIPEQRQVVRIVIEGDRPRVDVEPRAPVAVGPPRQKQTEEAFFTGLPLEVRVFADGLRSLREKQRDVSLSFGSSSLILRNRGANMLELYCDGRVRFRTNFFTQALGQEVAREYQDKLRSLFPAAMQMSYPSEKLDRQKADQLLALVSDVLSKAKDSSP